MNTELYEQKLKAVIQYVILNTDHKMTFWEINNKLFLIDMRIYGQTGKSLTNSVYVKKPQGAKLKGIEGILSSMLSENMLDENSFVEAKRYF